MPGGATWSFEWNPGALTARLRAAFGSSVREAAALAKARARWRHVAESVHVAGAGSTVAEIEASSPDARLLERGARAHEEAPHGEALRFEGGDQGFARGAIEHPGFHGEPFLQPAAESWPELYRRAARAALA
jgi:hypothetical protein